MIRRVFFNIIMVVILYYIIVYFWSYAVMADDEIGESLSVIFWWMLPP